jgi:hypothetical protein
VVDFVVDDEKLYVLLTYVSDTEWYKNVLENPLIRIGAAGAEVRDAGWQKSVRR